MTEDKMKLPLGWEEAEVGTLFSYVRGVTYKKEQSSSQPSEGYLPILRANNINGTLAYDDLVFVDKTVIEESQLVRSNDIVFAMSSGSKKHVGKSALSVADFDGAFGAFCGVLRPAATVNSRYFSYFFSTQEFRNYIEEISKGTNINNLKQEHLLNCRLRLPPAKEQGRIVEKIEELLSELDKGVESLKTAREQLKVYRQAVLKHAFEGKLTASWREENKEKLETPDQLLARIRKEREDRYQQQLTEWEVALRDWEARGQEGKRPTKPRKSEIPDRPSPEHERRKWELPANWRWSQIGTFSFVTKLAGFEYTKYVRYDEQGDMPVIKAENAGPNGYRATVYSKVQASSVAELTRSHLNGGELLMVFVGAGTGNVAMVPASQRFFLGPNIGMIRVESSAVNPAYIELFLRSPKGKELALAAVKAVAQPSLSMGTIRQIPVALPPSLEQEVIVAKLNASLSLIEQAEHDIEAQLARAETLRQSILRKAFSGRLVPQEAHDEPASVLLERIAKELGADRGAMRHRKVKEVTNA